MGAGVNEVVKDAAREAIVLCLNSGSSSLKFALFRIRADREERLAHGAIEGIGADVGNAWLARDGERQTHPGQAKDHAQAIERAFGLLANQALPEPTVASHRVVHGGPKHVQPTRVTGALLESLRKVVPLAPLHMPACLLGISAVKTKYPALPQVACFDTAFHANLPDVARLMPLPSRFSEVRRYGFHGLSYEYLMSTLGTPAPRRIVLAHLGNGASLVAVKDGQSIDTTMGLTPTGGILMGTRSGDLDPGVLVYLARMHGLDSNAIEHLLNHESGLLALGESSDMPSLIARAKTEKAARVAVAMFGYQIRKALGAFTAALGGVDLVVFSGGIGEHVPEVREHACDDLGYLGIELDAQCNRTNQPTISAATSRVSVRVIATDEDRMLARHAFSVLE